MIHSLIAECLSMLEIKQVSSANGFVSEWNIVRNEGSPPTILNCSGSVYVNIRCM